MKHTKGPWRVSGCRASHNGVDYPLVETAYEDHAPILAELRGQDRAWEEKVATAKLMAAAPALLEALKNCLPAVEAYTKQVVESRGANHDYATMWQSALSKAHKAIAEATSCFAQPIDKTEPEKRLCDSCGHKGDDRDSSDTESYCGSCGETVPYPKEDLCPACGAENCMMLACPKCGGLYRLDEQQSDKLNTYKLSTGEETTSTHMEGQYVCKFCGSSEVVYQQGVNDASCQDCGKWQNE